MPDSQERRIRAGVYGGSGYAGQQDEHALAPDEIVDALCLAADLWLASSSPIQVR
ncbi:MAG: hypothetical protein RI897_4487, partial [Verrucomicrobiota bacterium]